MSIIKLSIVIIAIAFISCTSAKNETVWVCDCEEQARSAQWVKDCLPSANNMSDEEMEDVINQLQKTAVQLNCHMENVKFESTESGLLYSSIDSCRIIFRY